MVRLAELQEWQARQEAARDAYAWTLSRLPYRCPDCGRRKRAADEVCIGCAKELWGR